MGDVTQLVNARINGKKVMVFSKSYCPYCKMAKKAFDNHVGKPELAEEDYDLWDMENDPKCQAIQDVLKKITGASSVPRVFINGKFVGGGSEITNFEKTGELKKLLEAKI